MKNYHRWAALAGAAMLAVSSVTTAWADESSQTGATADTAIQVPAFDLEQSGGTGVSGPTAADGINSGAEHTTAPQGVVSSDGPQQGGDSSGAQADGSTAVSEPGDASGGQTSGTAAGQPGDSSAQTPSQPTAPSGTGTTSSSRVIRVNGDASAAAASSQNSSAGTASSGIDYSLGPGAFYQQPQQTQDDQQSVPAENIQIFDVTNNPIVQTVEKYSYDQMVQDITLLKQRYSNYMQVNTIGTSLDGRAMYDCIIGNPAASKHILIQGGIHGREYLNPMLMMQQMEMALANYSTGSFHDVPLSTMFSQVAVHFVPMTNPDGVTISQFGMDGIRSQQLKDAIGTCYVMDTAAGRTTADPGTYLSRWKANAQGVDLNLNFDALWSDVYSTEFPSYSGYKGTAPGTEPETQAMMNLYNSQYPWKAVIHYHSMGDVIYWDILGNKVQAESSELANLMSAVTGGYRILPSEGGGGYKDWIQLGSNPVPSVTLETGTVACPMPLSEYETIWTQNRLTWAYAMEWVMGR